MMHSGNRNRRRVKVEIGYKKFVNRGECGDGEV
jgi:hypothetical protein